MDKGSGRYGLTNGVYKRLWGFYMPSSAVIVPKPPKPNSGGDVEPNYIVTELDGGVITESDQDLVVE